MTIDGDGHWWLCLDYRKCGPEGEPTVVHYDTESLDSDDGYEFRVADSFSDLLSGLYFDPGCFVFALDDPSILGAALHTRMMALGCKGEYLPDASAKDRKKPPQKWSWREFKGEFGKPADLFVYGNELDPWTLERPAKHPLLLVHVCRKGQQRCIRRLAKELGGSAVLIHQPSDRPAICGALH